jgi:hypothetical protein
MNMNAKQQAIETILEEVRTGRLVPSPYCVYTSKQDKEYDEYLRCSLLEWNQLNPITIIIDGLDTDNPIPKVLKGNKRLMIINQLRKEGILTFTPKIEYRELSKTQTTAGFYATSTFIVPEHTKLQRGVYGAVHLYAGERAKAEANQKANARTNEHFDTCKLVGKKVGCCDKTVRLGYKLVQEDNWFHQYVLVEKNEMSTSDAKELVYLVDPILKEKVIAKMKELHEKDKQEAINLVELAAKSENDEAAEEEMFLKDEDLRRFFKKEGKSLYRRARTNVEFKNLTPEEALKRAKKIVQSANGGVEPNDITIAKGKALAKAKGKTSAKGKKPPTYVSTYGDGINRILVDFKLPEDLAKVIIHVCAQCDINVTIESTYSSSELKEAV